MGAAVPVAAGVCCSAGEWFCSNFPCTCWMCCCVCCAASGIGLFAILGVVRVLRHPKVVVVGRSGSARDKLVALLEGSGYRASVKEGDGALTLLEMGGEEWTVGPVRIDVARAEATRADGSVERLTPRELKILALLSAEPGAVVTRDRLMNEAWGLNYFGTTRTVDQTVANLRAKLGPGVAIESVRGEGYRLG